MRYGTPQLSGHLFFLFLLVTVAGGAAYAKAAEDQTPAQSSETQTGKSVSSGSSSDVQKDARPAFQANDTQAAYKPAAATAQLAPASASEANPVRASARAGNESKPFFISAGDFIGQKVRDNSRNGEFVGRLGSLVIDVENGETVYAIIDRGGFLGFGQTHVVVPFELVVFPEQWGFPILDVSASKLDDAPQMVDRDLESLLHNPAWRRSVADYYGLGSGGKRPKATSSTAESTKEAASAGKETAVADGQSIAQTVCATCHTFKKGGGTLVGPNLFGVVGRPIASVAGYSYSTALKKLKGDWTPESLNAWLRNPSSYAPGTMMTFAGLKSDSDRQGVIDYLESLKTQGSASR